MTITTEELREMLISILNTSDVLGIKEAAAVTKMTEGSIRQLVHSRKIPFYKNKSEGRTLYFSRKELEAWCLFKRVKTYDESWEEHEINLALKHKAK